MSSLDQVAHSLAGQVFVVDQNGIECDTLYLAVNQDYWNSLVDGFLDRLNRAGERHHDDPVHLFFQKDLHLAAFQLRIELAVTDDGGKSCF